MITLPVRLTDIASELDLSIATVNRAIRGFGRVSPETRAKVLAKAAEMGYKTNMAASVLSSKKSNKFAVICADNFFFADLLKGVEAAAEEYSIYGFEAVQFLSHEYRVSTQVEHLEKVIESGEYCGILLAPAHPLLLNHLIAKAVSAGIPVVTMNNDAPSSDRICFVGQNGWMVGRMCAQLYNTILPAKSRVAILASQTPALGMKQRVDGFLDYCSKEQRLEIIGTFEYNDTVADAEILCKQVIQSLNPDAVYSTSGNGSVGCALASKSDATRHPFMIAFDINPKICEAIQDGTVFMTVLQDPFSQGFYAFRALYQRLSDMGNSQEEIHYTHTDIVMASNLEEYRCGKLVESGNFLK